MILSKHHGLGNDFLVVLDERHPGPLTITAADAVRWCDRRRGLGADGLIHGTRPSPEQAAAGADVVMHLFNSDGSRAEMSGNGIRCLGQAVARARGIAAGGIGVVTDVGPRPLDVSPTPDPRTVAVAVGMGTPGSGPLVPEPVAELLPGRFGTVDMGNPHLVILVDDPASVDLPTEGAWLEAQFPEGVNVEYIAPDPDGEGLALRVWERGAGVTEACGTGACAAAHEARQWGLVGERVAVTMPGGTCLVELGADRSVTLTGPAVWVADIDVTEAVAAGAVAEPTSLPVEA